MRIVFTLFVSLSLLACTTDKPNLDMANPASVYCESIGGESKIKDGAGYCYLPDGEVMIEWELYRRDHK